MNLKKKWRCAVKKAAILLILILLLALSACGESDMSGEVVEQNGDCLVVDGGEGLFAVRLGSNTASVEPETGFDGALLDIRGAKRDGSVDYDGESIKAYSAETVLCTGWLESGFMTLNGGVAVDVMHTDLFGDIYRLADGTELVCEKVSPFEANGLSDSAADAVKTWLEANVPYDIEDVVTAAYEEYQTLGEDFGCWMLTLDDYAGPVSERAAYFCTELTISDSSNVGDVNCRGRAFDRETGEKLDNWSLFNIPEAEARAELIRLAGQPEGMDLSRAAELLEADGICLTHDGVELYYPAGTLDEQMSVVFLGASEDLESIFQSWAVPDSWNSTQE